MAAQLDPGTVPVVSELVAALPLDDELNVFNRRTGRSLALNASAARIFDLVDGRRTVAEISTRLAETHGVAVDLVEGDVLAAVGHLVREGVLKTARRRSA